MRCSRVFSRGELSSWWDIVLFLGVEVIGWGLSCEGGN